MIVNADVRLERLWAEDTRLWIRIIVRVDKFKTGTKRL
jgi:hypothetical protein